MLLIKGLFITIISFSITYFIIPFLCRLSYAFGILDVPIGAIKVHSKPIPYLGGVAVFVGVLLSLLFQYSFDYQTIGMLFGFTAFLLIGFIDDMIVMKPSWKSFFQIIIIFLFIAAGARLPFVFIPEWFNIFCCLVWLLILVNAFNLVDVMDGLATTVALFCSFSYAIVAYTTEQWFIFFICSALFGSLMAFFYFNRPPARIYLGDAGALFLGGIFGTITLFLPWKSYDSSFGFFSPLLFLAIPLYEVVMLVIIRTTKGLPVYLGSPHHFFMYLKKQGWSTEKILKFVALFTCLLQVLGLALFFNILSIWFCFFSAIFLLCVWLILIFKQQLLKNFQS